MLSYDCTVTREYQRLSQQNGAGSVSVGRQGTTTVEVQALPPDAGRAADYTEISAGHQGTTEWRFRPSPLVQVKL